VDNRPNGDVPDPIPFQQKPNAEVALFTVDEQRGTKASSLTKSGFPYGCGTRHERFHSLGRNPPGQGTVELVPRVERLDKGHRQASNILGRPYCTGCLLEGGVIGKERIVVQENQDFARRMLGATITRNARSRVRWCFHVDYIGIFFGNQRSDTAIRAVIEYENLEGDPRLGER